MPKARTHGTLQAGIGQGLRQGNRDLQGMEYGEKKGVANSEAFSVYSCEGWAVLAKGTHKPFFS
jgi:hypothetical protein